MIYLPDYFKGNNLDFVLGCDISKLTEDEIHIEVTKNKPKMLENSTEVTITNNGFTAKYVSNRMYPLNTFGFYGFRGTKSTNVDFFQGETFLFSKTTNSCSSIVIHGKEGSTLKTENFFTIKERGKNNLSVYNFEGSFIKDVVIGADGFVEFKRVGDKYAIGITEEYCCRAPFTGLFNLDILFDIIECSDEYPYDKSRRHVPLTCESSDTTQAMIPLVATSEGFIVKVNFPVTYKFTETELGKLVTYDDAFNGIADFYEDMESIDILELLGLNEEQKSDAMNVLNSTSSTVCFKLDKLNDDQSSDLIQKISNAYEQVEQINKNKINRFNGSDKTNSS